MEQRKQKEIEYYNRQAQRVLEIREVDKVDFEGFYPLVLSSYSFLYRLIEKFCRKGEVLDYGCGNGIHSVFIAKQGAEVIGIDLSEKSLEIATKRIKKEEMEDKIEFLKMDCEKLDFPNNFFDVIFDGGTFSSLDLSKAYPELLRILKPRGHLIGIETFGHNPFTNLKRKINKSIGKRTSWAAEHILKIDNLEEAKKYFNKIEVYYFHLISWLAFPFLNLAWGKALLKLLESIDRVLLKIPFFEKYVFKVVFVFSEPKK
ncbi:MAG: class I SAM-dependent methyltransferase [Candidatus Paceibacterota bacterium]|jgi:ubiquinone/menaquinone biosynthesis C-methylase UbiE